MVIRTDIEAYELEHLSKYACKSAESKGRKFPEGKCEFRTEFQRDRDRIVHSKAFRRLMHKTQVFLAPEGDHYRTRLTHTLEVSQISRTIARALNLNEDLVEAIAAGHDLGHTPFGHNGEEVLNEIHPAGYKHNEQSLRVVDLIERSGDRRGMNLTEEVRDGILNHTGAELPMTLEGQIVKLSDRVAYINHDIDDAIRSRVITLSDLPKSSLEMFGTSHSQRVNSMIQNIISNSDEKDAIKMTPEYWSEMNFLRSYMFANVYKSDRVKREEELAKVEVIVVSLYKYAKENIDKMPSEIREIAKTEGLETAAKDYVAGMTDRFALNLYNKLFVPQAWK